VAQLTTGSRTCATLVYSRRHPRSTSRSLARETACAGRRVVSWKCDSADTLWRPFRRVETLPFGNCDKWRPLRLVLDDTTLTAEEVDLLVSFAQEEEFELWRTAPNVLPRLEIGEPFDASPAMRGALSIRDFAPNGTAGVFGVYGTQRLRQQAAEIARGEGAAEEEVFRALVFASATEESGSDAIVTRRSYLLEDEDARAAIAVTPDDAVALIGLAMRSHGNNSIGADMLGQRLSGSTFYFILSRDLLRAGWPWVGGCVASASHTGDDSIVYLGQTVHERFARVLQIRDRLHVAAKQEPTRTNGDTLVFELETLLLFLSAVFDAAARVAHVVYLDPGYEDAGWRRSDWRKRMEPLAPDLLSLTGDGTRGAAILQIIAALRNTIHGEALRATETGEPGGLTSQFVRLNGRESEKVTTRITDLGETPAEWGLREVHARSSLAADRFIEQLLLRAVALLNELMAATDTSLLPGAAGSPLIRAIDDTPRDRWWDDMLGVEIRQRVRMLGGFARASRPPAQGT
jgi:hypothetical protein